MSWGVHVLVRWDGMGWVCKLVGWVKKKWPMSTSEPTQLPSLGGTRNEYWPQCVDALWLKNKGRYGAFHLWINVLGDR